MAKTVFDVLIEQIEEQKESSVKFLTSAGPKDFSKYKEVTGLVRGLESSISIIKDLQRNQFEEDNE